MRKFLFICHKSISSFVHLMSIIAGMKGVKDPAKTATRDSKSEDIHNNPIYLSEVVRTIQYSFSMDQLEKPKELYPNSMGK